MNGRRGFTLIEVVIVMAIIGISLGMAAPRIGAGSGRIELNQAAQTIRTYIKLGRLRAQRTDRNQYIVLDKERRSVELVGPEMTVIRSDTLPRSVEFILQPDVAVEAVYVAPSGILRGDSVRLRGRTGEIEIALQ